VRAATRANELPHASWVRQGAASSHSPTRFHCVPHPTPKAPEYSDREVRRGCAEIHTTSRITHPSPTGSLPGITLHSLTPPAGRSVQPFLCAFIL
jgi:hypothetical protein